MKRATDKADWRLRGGLELITSSWGDEPAERPENYLTAIVLKREPLPTSRA